MLVCYIGTVFLLEMGFGVLTRMFGVWVVVGLCWGCGLSWGWGCCGSGGVGVCLGCPFCWSWCFVLVLGMCVVGVCVELGCLGLRCIVGGGWVVVGVCFCFGWG